MTTSHELANLLLSMKNLPIVLRIDCAKNDAIGEHEDHPLEDLKIDERDSKIEIGQYVFDTKIYFEQFPDPYKDTNPTKALQ